RHRARLHGREADEIVRSHNRWDGVISVRLGPLPARCYSGAAIRRPPNPMRFTTILALAFMLFAASAYGQRVLDPSAATTKPEPIRPMKFSAIRTRRSAFLKGSGCSRMASATL